MFCRIIVLVALCLQPSNEQPKISGLIQDGGLNCFCGRPKELCFVSFLFFDSKLDIQFK